MRYPRSTCCNTSVFDIPDYGISEGDIHKHFGISEKHTRQETKIEKMDDSLTRVRDSTIRDKLGQENTKRPNIRL